MEIMLPANCNAMKIKSLFLAILAILAFTQSISIWGQERERVLIVAKGIDLPSERLVETFVDDFHDALLNATNKRYEIRNGRDVFEEMRQSHLQLQSDGYIKDEELAMIGHEIGAQYVFGIVVEKDAIDNDYYFRAKVIEVERDGVPWSARYPIEVEGDKKVTELTRYNRQTVALILIDRLGFLHEKEQAEWHNKVEELRRQQESSESIARELAIREQSERFRQQKRVQSQQRMNDLFRDYFEPLNSWGVYVGYAPRGCRIATQFDIKYLSLGIGTTWGFSEKAFPINSSEAYGGFFRENGETYPAQYDIADMTLNFSVGLNFKYFGLSILPEIYFLKNPNKNPYVEKKYSRALITYAPTLHIHVPFNLSRPEAAGAILARIGYSFAPTISYNPGFFFEIGIGHMW